MTPEELEELIRWSEIRRRRGYAKKYARETAEEGAVAELDTAKEWAEAALSLWDMRVTHLRSNLDHKGVPDVFGTMDTSEIGIELTEFVDETFLDKVQATKPNVAPMRLHEHNSHFGQGFVESQWSEARFASLLRKSIEKKNAKYERNGHVIDVLVLHTDEDWLTIENVKEWLKPGEFGPYPALRSCYFLMYSRPGTDDPATVLKIF